MTTIETTKAICVLTARGIEKILAEGGSQAWVLDAKRARKLKYVVCVQNCGFTDDWGDTSAPHHTAFLVGRLKEVTRSPEHKGRWVLTFSDYAEINKANAWPGFRNPVLYTDLEKFDIDVNSLDFHPMPEQEQEVPLEDEPKALTMAEAKEGLALTFGVPVTNIEITIRG